VKVWFLLGFFKIWVVGVVFWMVRTW
jgi:hypothetical protein